MNKKEWVKVINWKSVGLCVISILLVSIIIFLLCCDNSSNIQSIYRENMLDGIANPSMIIINEESKDKYVYLQNLGISEELIDSFEIQMDSRLNSAYALVVIEASKDNIENVEIALRRYLISKQNYLSLENEDTLQKSRVNLIDTINIDATKGYVVMAMGENAEDLMENTKNKLMNK